MDWIKKHLGTIGLLFLFGYTGMLLFTALDDYLGWEILVKYF